MNARSDVHFAMSYFNPHHVHFMCENALGSVHFLNQRNLTQFFFKSEFY